MNLSRAMFISIVPKTAISAKATFIKSFIGTSQTLNAFKVSPIKRIAPPMILPIKETVFALIPFSSLISSAVISPP